MTKQPTSRAERARANEVKRRVYAKEAPKYDENVDFIERLLFGTEHRGWVCSRATGDTSRSRSVPGSTCRTTPRTFASPDSTSPGTCST
jgi:hypothetical protein